MSLRLALFLPLIISLAVSCRREEPPSVVLITLDTLRADRIGVYGYDLTRTPNLDALAAEGARFESAIAQAPLTLPSHTTLFTGTFPFRHGIRDNGGYILGPELKTLAEIAKERGYRTGAFVSAFVLDSKWGLDRGFDLYFDDFDLSRYERISLGSVERIAEETVEEFLGWLNGVGEERFFAWVHLYDPHAPYDAPEPFGSEHADRPYDGEVAYVDAAVGRILGFLKARGLYETAVIVVAGDHGEGLGDHRELTHGNFVYDSTLRVPLIMRLPGFERPGLAVRQQVGLIDLFPTLAEILGRPIPSQSQGRSLLPLLRGEGSTGPALLAESMYPRFHYGWSEVVALRTDRYKLIDTPRPELYDLEADPGEERNLASEEPALLGRMQRALEERLASAPSAPISAEPLDPETERRLRALGYLGGASAPPPEVSRRELSDPKDKIEILQAVARADFLSAQKRHEEAIALLQGVLAEDPDVVDAHLSLGNLYSATGRYQEAVAEFRKCLELSPDYGLALTNLALAYKLLGQLEDAALGFERVLELDPENRQALFNLGEIRLYQKNYESALSFFKRGLALEPSSPIFLRQSGVAYFYLGSVDAAEQKLTQARAARQDLDSVHYTLALLYEKLGRLEEAESAYKEEIRLNRGSMRASFNLASLYASQGRVEEQIRLLEELTKSHSDWAPAFFQLAKAYRDTQNPVNFPKALAAVDRALALDPSSPYAPLAYFIRADLLDRAGRKEEARSAFERGKALETAKH